MSLQELGSLVFHHQKEHQFHFYEELEMRVVVILKKIIDDVPIRRSLISGMPGILKGSLCGSCGNGDVCGLRVHESPEWTAKLIGSGGNKKASMMPAFLWYYRDSNLGHTDFQSVALPTEL